MPNKASSIIQQTTMDEFEDMIEAENEIANEVPAAEVPENKVEAMPEPTAIFSEKLRLDLLFSFIWKKKWKILLILVVAGIIFSLLALSVPRYYQVEVKLAPEYNNGSGASSMGGLGSLASMAGINLNGMNSSDAITPTFYPDLMQSTEFIVPLLYTPVRTKDNDFSGTFVDFITKKSKATWWDEAFVKLKNWIKPPDPKSLYKGEARINPFQMNYGEDEVVRALMGSINCNVDKKTDIISIKMTAQDPMVAALMADTIKARLQDFITEYRTRKSRGDYEHLQTLCAEAKVKYIAAQKKYSSYVDTHQDLMLESFRSEEEALENEMQMAYNIYSALQQQQQLAYAKVQERTPVFTTIQNATVPVKHAGPKRMIFVASMLLFTFVVSVIVMIARSKQYRF